MSLKEQRGYIKLNKALSRQLKDAEAVITQLQAQRSSATKRLNDLERITETLEMRTVLLRADILERVTEFVNQMEVIFALVDYIFDESDVSTLREAQSKWTLFKTTVNESQSAQQAIDSLGIEINISSSANQQLVMDQWQKDKAQAKAGEANAS